MSEYYTLMFRNVFRHKLRTCLTIVGVIVALFAFCMIRTLIDSWYSGVKASAKNRLIVRNRVSLVFYLPVAYKNQIAQVPGVAKVGFGNWFGGIYKDEKFRFAQFAIDDDYLEVYPEYLIPSEEKTNFDKDRKGAIAGIELAEQFDLKVGQTIQVKGTIFPGLWEYNISGIFRGREDSTRSKVLLFHWDYLNERNKAEIQRQPDHAGFFVVQLEPDADVAAVSKAIDQRFANSYAETITETETAFQQGFISMSSTIISALTIVSGVVLVIMLLVLGNTMLMSARERYREYSILKSIGFKVVHVMGLIMGESLLIVMTGFFGFCILLIPVFSLPPSTILGDLSLFFPIFRLNPVNLLIAFILALAVGLIAGIGPARYMAKMKVVDGLRGGD